MFTKKILIVSIIVALAAGFFGGVLFINNKDISSTGSLKQLINTDLGKPSDIDFSLFWRVWDSLNAKYVDKGKIDAEKALYGAIQGMVNSIGDPYTVFFEPTTSKQFQEEISGSFSGIGIEIGKRNNILTVIAPLKDTPAYKAGLKAGDKIIKIDAKSTTDMPIDQAVNLIRGKNGTKVTLTIISGDNKSREIQLTRENIKVPTVDWELIPDGSHKVAYMQIYSFNEQVDAEFQKASQEILKSNADRLVIDLRNNPGGLLDSAINLAGWFLDKGKLVVTEAYSNGTHDDFRSNGNASLKSYQTIILINGGSASASEILAGALHDNRGIKLVGEKSFGKGSVQELQKFSDGSSLKVTIAKWLTPNGISISEKGIEPDVKVTIPQADIDQNKIEIGTPSKDPQLDKALELLK